MTTNIIIGIDPGLSGALAFIKIDDGSMCIRDMPTALKTINGKKRRIIDRERLRALFDRDDVLHVVLEGQRGMNGQGAHVSHVHGHNTGILEGLCLANYHPYTIVAPSTWKRDMEVPKDKDKARARAAQLLPSVAHRFTDAGQDGRAEAALLAFYAFQVLNLTPPAIQSVE